MKLPTAQTCQHDHVCLCESSVCVPVCAQLGACLCECVGVRLEVWHQDWLSFAGGVTAPFAVGLSLWNCLPAASGAAQLLCDSTSLPDIYRVSFSSILKSAWSTFSSDSEFLNIGGTYETHTENLDLLPSPLSFFFTFLETRYICLLLRWPCYLTTHLHKIRMEGTHGDFGGVG